MVKKGIVIGGERDITHEMLTRNLTKVLRLLPDENSAMGDNENQPLDSGGDVVAAASEGGEDSVSPSPIPTPDENVRSLSDGAREFGALVVTETDEDCIICCDSAIDCVSVPCGHQVLCLQCSKNITRCPVCAQDCSFMRVFKP